MAAVPDVLDGAGEARFRLLVESVKDYAIFMLDPAGYITTWNIGAERIKGYQAHEIIGKHFSTFYSAEEAASGKCDRELEIAASEGRFEEEGWRIRKDGSRMWANVTITALRNPDGGILGFAKVTRDLTERRRAEESQRALAVERAAVAEKARIQEFQERFLGILGHDLRNPLAAITMGAAILHQQITDPRMLNVIARVQSSSIRMSRMIEQILDLTRTRLAGGLDLRPEPTDLFATISGIVEELRIAYPQQVIDVRCPTVIGNWDRDRLEQVFSNLIGNAVTYGEVTRPITVVAREEKRLVEVDIHNDGEPISEELQPAIFNPFRRGERDSRTAKTAGLGLGLYISHEIIRAHAGTIALRSNQSEGTTFRVTLPCDGPGAPGLPELR